MLLSIEGSEEESEGWSSSSCQDSSGPSSPTASGGLGNLTRTLLAQERLSAPVDLLHMWVLEWIHTQSDVLVELEQVPQFLAQGRISGPVGSFHVYICTYVYTYIHIYMCGCIYTLILKSQAYTGPGRIIWFIFSVKKSRDWGIRGTAGDIESGATKKSR